MVRLYEWVGVPANDLGQSFSCVITVGVDKNIKVTGKVLKNGGTGYVFWVHIGISTYKYLEVGMHTK